MAEQPIIKGIGFSTHGNGNLADLDAALGRIADTGATHAELSLNQEDLVLNGRILWPRARQLEQICARRGLGYTVHGPICMNFMDEGRLDLHRAVARAFIDLTALVGADVLVHHGGRIAAGPWPALDRLLDLERRALVEAADYAGSKGVRLAVENLFMEGPDQFACDPVQLAGQLARLDHPAVCATLDFSHAYLMCTWKGLPYAETVAALAPWVGHLHVHDSFGRPPGLQTYSTAERLAYGQGDLHLPLGWGDIPWDTLLPRLQVRPGTVMIVELPPRWHAEMAETLATARRHARLLEEAHGRRAA